MLVDERRETVGVLRLIGLPVHRILVQILLEGLLVAVVGCGVRSAARARVGGRSSTASSNGVTTRHWCSSASRRASRDVRLDCRATRRRRHRGCVVGTASPQRPATGAPMRALPFAWRSLVRQPARATLGIIGVAAVGALLFDMLMLSAGPHRVDARPARQDGLRRACHDAPRNCRGTAPRMEGAAASALRPIRQLPDVRTALGIRFADATIDRAEDETRHRHVSWRDRQRATVDRAARARPSGRRRSWSTRPWPAPAASSRAAGITIRPSCESDAEALASGAAAHRGRCGVSVRADSRADDRRAASRRSTRRAAAMAATGPT